MSTYQVTLELVIHCPVRVCVEARSKEEALSLASGLVPSSIHEAAANQNNGWKAAVNVRPPKGVIVNQFECRATNISQTSGAEKVRRLP